MTTPVRVLAVDDRRENLLALQAILEGLPIEVVPVTNGEDALKQLLVKDYALILLDAQMPGMDGFETAKHVKQRERTRHIPILFLTAADYDPHMAFRGYQAGAVDYITKPRPPGLRGEGARVGGEGGKEPSREDTGDAHRAVRASARGGGRAGRARPVHVKQVNGDLAVERDLVSLLTQIADDLQ